MLKGKLLFVLCLVLFELEEDEFFYDDFEGLVVCGIDGVEIG